MSLDTVVCVAQVWQASQDIQPIFAGIDQLVGQNIRRVQSAMQKQRIGPHHFSGSTGYGHGDLGREAFDSVSALLSRLAAVRQEWDVSFNLTVFCCAVIAIVCVQVSQHQLHASAWCFCALISRKPYHVTQLANLSCQVDLLQCREQYAAATVCYRASLHDTAMA